MFYTSLADIRENKEDEDFIDNTEIQNNSSNYYGLLNVTKTQMLKMMLF